MIKSLNLILILLFFLPVSFALNKDDALIQSTWEPFWFEPVNSKKISYKTFKVASDHMPGLHSKYIRFDENLHTFVNTNTPYVNFYVPKTWDNRSAGTKWQGRLQIPVDFIVPDAYPGNTPNYPTTIYNRDSKTAVLLNGISRPSIGGSIWGYRLSPTQATHGGSGLSGGEISLSEIKEGQINHAIGILVWGKKYLSRQDGGYISPALKADSNYSNPQHLNYYNGDIKQLKMGTRLAIPDNVTAESLDIKSNKGLILFNSFKDYGGYIIDNSGWDTIYISSTPDAKKELQGIDADIVKIMQALAIVEMK